MTQDYADFLGALNREGAAYVVIGGMAVLALIPYRTTRDLDVLIEPTPEHAANPVLRITTSSGMDGWPVNRGLRAGARLGR